MQEMSCDAHDIYSAQGQFTSHFIARTLQGCNIEPTPIDTPSFTVLRTFSEGLCQDSIDLFYGLYRYNKHASEQLRKIKDAISKVENELTGEADSDNNSNITAPSLST